MTLVAARAKHSAPGQYLGFALQPVRLCYHLLTCAAGAQVSLEYWDDIAVHWSDGRVLLEQCKSALKQDPLSDWAADLWKTIANWLDFLAAGQIAPDTATFRLYVTPAHTGNFAQLLNAACTTADVEAITSAISAGIKTKKTSPSLPYVTRFLSATEEERAAVLTRMSILSVDADPLSPLRDRLETTVSPSLIDLMCKAAIGMAKQEADNLIRLGQPAILDAENFRAAFRAFVQKNNLPGLLTSLSTTPPEVEVAGLLASRPIFIRQLELIEPELTSAYAQSATS